MVQMPSGIPVACVAIDGAENAAILAAQMLALKYGEIGQLLAEHKRAMAEAVAQKDKKLQEAVAQL